eukprot:scaffold2844_cov326-Pavlova_lutheri.AAC.25
MPVVSHRGRTAHHAHPKLAQSLPELQIFPTVLGEVGVERTGDERIRNTSRTVPNGRFQEPTLGDGDVPRGEEGRRTIRGLERFRRGFREVVGVDDPAVGEGAWVSVHVHGSFQGEGVLLQEVRRHHQVGIDEDDHVATRIGHASVPRRGSATVGRFHQPQVRVRVGVCLQVLDRSVRGSVVHHHHLVRQTLRSASLVRSKTLLFQRVQALSQDG